VKIEPFELERWLLQEAEIDLAMGGITRLRVHEVAPIAHDTILTYGRTDGSVELRELVTQLYPGTDSDQVLITTGTSEANFLTIFSLVEPGSEVVAINPTYMQHRALANALGARVVAVPLVEDRGWALDLEAIARNVTDRTRAILLVSPNNPEGSVVSEAAMAEICRLADRVGAWVVCDGALRGSEVDGRLAVTPVEHSDRGIATGGLSKLGLPGIRVGWVVGDPAFIHRCWTAKDYVTLSHAGISETLAIAALQPDRLPQLIERVRMIVRANLARMESWMNQMKEHVSWTTPEGGFTSFPSYASPIDSVTLCRRLLAEEGVLLAPGDLFGVARHYRIRHSGEADELLEGLARLRRFLERIASEPIGRVGDATAF